MKANKKDLERAAPELLEVLKGALPWLKRAIKTGPHAKHWANGHDNMEEIELLRRAEAAISFLKRLSQ